MSCVGFVVVWRRLSVRLEFCRSDGTFTLRNEEIFSVESGRQTRTELPSSRFPDAKRFRRMRSVVAPQMLIDDQNYESVFICICRYCYNEIRLGSLRPLSSVSFRKNREGFLKCSGQKFIVDFVGILLFKIVGIKIY